MSLSILTVIQTSKNLFCITFSMKNFIIRINQIKKNIQQKYQLSNIIFSQLPKKHKVKFKMVLVNILILIVFPDNLVK